MDSKKWYLSKGVAGSMAAIITTVLLLCMRIFGVNAEAEQASITEIVTIGIALVGGIFALIGRLRATKEIK